MIPHHTFKLVIGVHPRPYKQCIRRGPSHRLNPSLLPPARDSFPSPVFGLRVASPLTIFRSKTTRGNFRSWFVSHHGFETQTTFRSRDPRTTPTVPTLKSNNPPLIPSLQSQKKLNPVSNHRYDRSRLRTDSPPP